jgi:hypothetical protein
MTREEAKEYIFECLDHDEATEIIKALCPESCGDCVSRQALLDIDFKRIVLTTAKPAEMIRQKIQELPPVTPTPKWIPCSERLPEEDGEYLVTIKWKGSYSGDVYTETNIGEYRKKSKDWDRVGITAWMPLPEPYKAESEDKE